MSARYCSLVCLSIWQRALTGMRLYQAVYFLTPLESQLLDLQVVRDVLATVQVVAKLNCLFVGYFDLAYSLVVRHKILLLIIRLPWFSNFYRYRLLLTLWGNYLDVTPGKYITMIYIYIYIMWLCDNLRIRDEILSTDQFFWDRIFRGNTIIVFESNWPCAVHVPILAVSSTGFECLLLKDVGGVVVGQVTRKLLNFMIRKRHFWDQKRSTRNVFNHETQLAASGAPVILFKPRSYPDQYSFRVALIVFIGLMNPKNIVFNFENKNTGSARTHSCSNSGRPWMSSKMSATVLIWPNTLHISAAISRTSRSWWPSNRNMPAKRPVCETSNGTPADLKNNSSVVISRSTPAIHTSGVKQSAVILLSILCKLLIGSFDPEKQQHRGDLQSNTGDSHERCQAVSDNTTDNTSLTSPMDCYVYFYFFYINNNMFLPVFLVLMMFWLGHPEN